MTSTRDAHALGPVDVEIGAKVGAGTSPASGGVNPLGFGLGGRAGVVLFDHLYGGVNLLYYFGSGSTPGLALSPGNQTNTSSYSLSEHTLMYGVEAGWGFKLLDVLTIRPQVGLGNATFGLSASCPSSAAGCALPSTGSTSNIYVEPGVTALLGLGTFFVGADANALLFPGLANSNAAFTAHGQVGVKF